MQHPQWHCTHAFGVLWLTFLAVAAAEPGLAAVVQACKNIPDLLQSLDTAGGCGSSRKVEVSVAIVIALAATYFAATYFLLIGKLRSYRRQAYTVVQVGIVYSKLQVAVFACLWYMPRAGASLQS